VRVVVDQEPIAKGLTPGVADMRTKDGKVYSERVEILRGDPRKLTSAEETAKKFSRCAALCRKPTSHEGIDSIYMMVRNLETAPDMCQVFGVIT